MNKQYYQFSSINNYLNVPLYENITAPVFSSSESLACHWTPPPGTSLFKFKSSLLYHFITFQKSLLWCNKGHCYLSQQQPRPGVCSSLRRQLMAVLVFDPFQTPGRSSNVTTECFVGGFMFYALFEASLAHPLRKSKRSENKYDSWPLKCK